MVDHHESEDFRFHDAEFLTQLFDVLPDAIMIVDHAGAIRRANAQATVMFGRARNELLGHALEEFIELPSGEPIHRFDAGLGCDSRAFPSRDVQGARARRSDGTDFPADILLAPINSKRERFAVAIVRDVTDRWSAEAHARQSEALFYRLFEFAPDAILVVNTSGIITRANQMASDLFGHDRESIVGQAVEFLVPSRFAGYHLKYRSEYIAAPRTRPMGAGVELFGLRSDGSEFPVDIMLSPVWIDGQQYVLGVVRDITERKLAAEHAMEVLRRETLVREVHHRVKNNLQVISSLFYLQSTYIQDPATLEILRESQTRLASIALIHEKLYRSEQLEKINCDEYVRDLVSDLARAYSIAGRSIIVIPDVTTMVLGVDTAIPCGLLLNELISNAFKHAFSGRSGGEVRIDLHPSGSDTFVLTVADNGIGLASDLNLEHCASFGLRLVSDLTRQLDGHLEVSSAAGQGTAFRVEFTEMQYKGRG